MTLTFEIKTVQFLCIVNISVKFYKDWHGSLVWDSILHLYKVKVWSHMNWLIKSQKQCYISPSQLVAQEYTWYGFSENFLRHLQT